MEKFTIHTYYGHRVSDKFTCCYLVKRKYVHLDDNSDNRNWKGLLDWVNKNFSLECHPAGIIQNASDENIIISYILAFICEEDAMAFKLKWT